MYQQIQLRKKLNFPSNTNPPKVENLEARSKKKNRINFFNDGGESALKELSNEMDELEEVILVEDEPALQLPQLSNECWSNFVEELSTKYEHGHSLNDSTRTSFYTSSSESKSHSRLRPSENTVSTPCRDTVATQNERLTVGIRCDEDDRCSPGKCADKYSDTEMLGTEYSLDSQRNNSGQSNANLGRTTVGDPNHLLDKGISDSKNGTIGGDNNTTSAERLLCKTPIQSKSSHCGLPSTNKKYQEIKNKSYKLTFHQILNVFDNEKSVPVDPFELDFPDYYMREFVRAVKDFQETETAEDVKYLWAQVKIWLSAMKSPYGNSSYTKYHKKLNWYITELMATYINFEIKNITQTECNYKLKMESLTNAVSSLLNDDVKLKILTLLRTDFPERKLNFSDDIFRKFLINPKVRLENSDYGTYRLKVLGFQKWKYYTSRLKNDIVEIAVKDGSAYLPKLVPINSEDPFYKVDNIAQLINEFDKEGTRKLLETDLSADMLKTSIDEYLQVYENQLNDEFGFNVFRRKDVEGCNTPRIQNPTSADYSTRNQRHSLQTVPLRHDMRHCSRRRPHCSNVCSNSSRATHLSTGCDMQRNRLSNHLKSNRHSRKLLAVRNQSDTRLSGTKSSNDIISLDSTDDDDDDNNDKGNDKNLTERSKSITHKIHQSSQLNKITNKQQSKYSRHIDHSKPTISIHSKSGSAHLLRKKSLQHKQLDTIVLDSSSDGEETLVAGVKEDENKTDNVVVQQVVPTADPQQTPRVQQRNVSRPLRCALMGRVAIKPIRKEKHCIPGEVSSTTSHDILESDRNNQTPGISSSASLEVNNSSAYENAREVGTVEILDRRELRQPVVMAERCFRPGKLLLGIDYSDDENDDDDAVDRTRDHVTASSDVDGDDDEISNGCVLPIAGYSKVVEEATSSTEIFPRTNSLETEALSTVLRTVASAPLVAMSKEEAPTCSRYAYSMGSIPTELNSRLQKDQPKVMPQADGIQKNLTNVNNVNINEEIPSIASKDMTTRRMSVEGDIKAEKTVRNSNADAEIRNKKNEKEIHKDFDSGIHNEKYMNLMIAEDSVGKNYEVDVAAERCAIIENDDENIAIDKILADIDESLRNFSEINRHLKDRNSTNIEGDLVGNIGSREPYPIDLEHSAEFSEVGRDQRKSLNIEKGDFNSDLAAENGKSVLNELDEDSEIKKCENWIGDVLENSCNLIDKDTAAYESIQNLKKTKSIAECKIAEQSACNTDITTDSVRVESEKVEKESNKSAENDKITDDEQHNSESVLETVSNVDIEGLENKISSQIGRESVAMLENKDPHLENCSSINKNEEIGPSTDAPKKIYSFKASYLDEIQMNTNYSKMESKDDKACHAETDTQSSISQVSLVSVDPKEKLESAELEGEVPHFGAAGHKENSAEDFGSKEDPVNKGNENKAFNLGEESEIEKTNSTQTKNEVDNITRIYTNEMEASTKIVGKSKQFNDKPTIASNETNSVVAELLESAIELGGTDNKFNKPTVCDINKVTAFISTQPTECKSFAATKCSKIREQSNIQLNEDKEAGKECLNETESLPSNAVPVSSGVDTTNQGEKSEAGERSKECKETTEITKISSNDVPKNNVISNVDTLNEESTITFHTPNENQRQTEKKTSPSDVNKLDLSTNFASPIEEEITDRSSGIKTDSTDVILSEIVTEEINKTPLLSESKFDELKEICHIAVEESLLSKENKNLNLTKSIAGNDLSNDNGVVEAVEEILSFVKSNELEIKDTTKESEEPTMASNQHTNTDIGLSMESQLLEACEAEQNNECSVLDSASGSQVAKNSECLTNDEVNDDSIKNAIKEKQSNDQTEVECGEVKESTTEPILLKEQLNINTEPSSGQYDSVNIEAVVNALEDSARNVRISFEEEEIKRTECSDETKYSNSGDLNGATFETPEIIESQEVSLPDESNTEIVNEINSKSLEDCSIHLQESKLASDFQDNEINNQITNNQTLLTKTNSTVVDEQKDHVTNYPQEEVVVTKHSAESAEISVTGDIDASAKLDEGKCDVHDDKLSSVEASNSKSTPTNEINVNQIEEPVAKKSTRNECDNENDRNNDELQDLELAPRESIQSNTVAKPVSGDRSTIIESKSDETQNDKNDVDKQLVDDEITGSCKNDGHKSDINKVEIETTEISSNESETSKEHASNRSFCFEKSTANESGVNVEAVSHNTSYKIKGKRKRNSLRKLMRDADKRAARKMHIKRRLSQCSDMGMENTEDFNSTTVLGNQNAVTAETAEELAYNISKLVIKESSEEVENIVGDDNQQKQEQESCSLKNNDNLDDANTECRKSSPALLHDGDTELSMQTQLQKELEESTLSEDCHSFQCLPSDYNSEEILAVTTLISMRNKYSSVCSTPSYAGDDNVVAETPQNLAENEDFNEPDLEKTNQKEEMPRIKSALKKTYAKDCSVKKKVHYDEENLMELINEKKKALSKSVKFTKDIKKLRTSEGVLPKGGNKNIKRRLLELNSNLSLAEEDHPVDIIEVIPEVKKKRGRRKVEPTPTENTSEELIVPTEANESTDTMPIATVEDSPPIYPVRLTSRRKNESAIYIRLPMVVKNKKRVKFEPKEKVNTEDVTSDFIVPDEKVAALGVPAKDNITKVSRICIDGTKVKLKIPQYDAVEKPKTLAKDKHDEKSIDKIEGTNRKEKPSLQLELSMAKKAVVKIKRIKAPIYETVTYKKSDGSGATVQHKSEKEITTNSTCKELSATLQVSPAESTKTVSDLFASSSLPSSPKLRRGVASPSLAKSSKLPDKICGTNSSKIKAAVNETTTSKTSVSSESSVEPQSERVIAENNKCTELSPSLQEPSIESSKPVSDLLASTRISQSPKLRRGVASPSLTKSSNLPEKICGANWSKIKAAVNESTTSTTSISSEASAEPQSEEVISENSTCKDRSPSLQEPPIESSTPVSDLLTSTSILPSRKLRRGVAPQLLAESSNLPDKICGTNSSKIKAAVNETTTSKTSVSSEASAQPQSERVLAENSTFKELSTVESSKPNPQLLASTSISQSPKLRRGVASPSLAKSSNLPEKICDANSSKSKAAVNETTTSKTTDSREASTQQQSEEVISENSTCKDRSPSLQEPPIESSTPVSDLLTSTSILPSRKLRRGVAPPSLAKSSNLPDKICGTNSSKIKAAVNETTTSKTSISSEASAQPQSERVLAENSTGKELSTVESTKPNPQLLASTSISPSPKLRRGVASPSLAKSSNLPDKICGTNSSKIKAAVNETTTSKTSVSSEASAQPQSEEVIAENSTCKDLSPSLQEPPIESSKSVSELLASASILPSRKLRRGVVPQSLAKSSNLPDKICGTNWSKIKAAVNETTTSKTSVSSEASAQPQSEEVIAENSTCKDLSPSLQEPPIESSKSVSDSSSISSSPEVIPPPLVKSSSSSLQESQVEAVLKTVDSSKLPYPKVGRGASRPQSAKSNSSDATNVTNSQKVPTGKRHSKYTKKTKTPPLLSTPNTTTTTNVSATKPVSLENINVAKMTEDAVKSQDSNLSTKVTQVIPLIEKKFSTQEQIIAEDKIKTEPLEEIEKSNFTIENLGIKEEEEEEEVPVDASDNLPVFLKRHAKDIILKPSEVILTAEKINEQAEAHRGFRKKQKIKKPEQKGDTKDSNLRSIKRKSKKKKTVIKDSDISARNKETPSVFVELEITKVEETSLEAPSTVEDKCEHATNSESLSIIERQEEDNVNVSKTYEKTASTEVVDSASKITENVIAELKLLSPENFQNNEDDKEVKHEEPIAMTIDVNIEMSNQSQLPDDTNSCTVEKSDEEKKTAQLLDSSIDIVLGNSTFTKTNLKSTVEEANSAADTIIDQIDKQRNKKSSDSVSFTTPKKNRLDVLTAEKINSVLEKMLEEKNHLKKEKKTNSSAELNVCHANRRQAINEDEGPRKAPSRSSLSSVKEISAKVPEALFADDESESSNADDSTSEQFFAPILSLDDLLIKKDESSGDLTTPYDNQETAEVTQTETVQPRDGLGTPNFTVELEVETTSASNENTAQAQESIGGDNAKVDTQCEETVKCGEGAELNTNLEETDASFSLSAMADISTIDIPSDLSLNNEYPDLLDAMLFEQVRQSIDCMISGTNSAKKWSQDSFATAQTPAQFNHNQIETAPRVEEEEHEVPLTTQEKTITTNDGNKVTASEEALGVGEETFLGTISTLDEVEVPTTGFDLVGSFTIAEFLSEAGSDLFPFPELDKTQSRSNSFSTDSNACNTPPHPFDEAADESVPSSNKKAESATQLSQNTNSVACDHSYNKDINEAEKLETKVRKKSASSSPPRCLVLQSPQKSYVASIKSPTLLNTFSRSKCHPKPFWKVKKADDDIITSTPKKEIDETPSMHDSQEIHVAEKMKLIVSEPADKSIKSVAKKLTVFSMPALEVPLPKEKTIAVKAAVPNDEVIAPVQHKDTRNISIASSETAEKKMPSEPTESTNLKADISKVSTAPTSTIDTFILQAEVAEVGPKQVPAEEQAAAVEPVSISPKRSATPIEITEVITIPAPVIVQPIIRIRRQTNRLERIDPESEQVFLHTSQENIAKLDNVPNTSSIEINNIIRPARDSTPTLDERINISPTDSIIAEDLACSSFKAKDDSSTQLDEPPAKRACIENANKQLSANEIFDILKREEKIHNRNDSSTPRCLTNKTESSGSVTITDLNTSKSLDTESKTLKELDTTELRKNVEIVTESVASVPVKSCKEESTAILSPNKVLSTKQKTIQPNVEKLTDTKAQTISAVHSKSVEHHKSTLLKTTAEESPKKDTDTKANLKPLKICDKINQAGEKSLIKPPGQSVETCKKQKDVSTTLESTKDNLSRNKQKQIEDTKQVQSKTVLPKPYTSITLADNMNPSPNKTSHIATSPTNVVQVKKVKTATTCSGLPKESNLKIKIKDDIKTTHAITLENVVKNSSQDVAVKSHSANKAKDLQTNEVQHKSEKNTNSPYQNVSISPRTKIPRKPTLAVAPTLLSNNTNRFHPYQKSQVPHTSSNAYRNKTTPQKQYIPVTADTNARKKETTARSDKTTSFQRTPSLVTTLPPMQSRPPPTPASSNLPLRNTTLTPAGAASTKLSPEDEAEIAVKLRSYRAALPTANTYGEHRENQRLLKLQEEKLRLEYVERANRRKSQQLRAEAQRLKRKSIPDSFQSQYKKFSMHSGKPDGASSRSGGHQSRSSRQYLQQYMQRPRPHHEYVNKFGEIEKLVEKEKVTTDSASKHSGPLTASTAWEPKMPTGDELIELFSKTKKS